MLINKLPHSLLQASPLSAQLRKYCAQLSVAVLRQELTTLTAHEQQILKVNEPNSFLREVHILGDGIPLIHGRTVISNATYKKYQQELDNLGNKFIGEDFLYKFPYNKSPFTYFNTQNNAARSCVINFNDDFLFLAETFLWITHN